jgi:flavin reductase (DIM6/NTAB) family NADH-FMN oxidoreductase RutF
MTARNQMHQIVEPAILYMGTPVVLISTENEDGTVNLAPISLAWWLGHRYVVIGLGALSQTTIKLLRTGQCTLIMPSDDTVPYVNALARSLARTTETNVVPPSKQMLGYRQVKDKFGISGSDLVRPSRAGQCPIRLEAEIVAVDEFVDDVADGGGFFFKLEIKVVRVHAEEDILREGRPNRIDPDNWRAFFAQIRTALTSSRDFGSFRPAGRCKTWLQVQVIHPAALLLPLSPHAY